MEKIWQALQLVAPKKGDIGIEVEVEGENLSIVDQGYWRTEADGSLRGRYPGQSAEYVLAEPVLVSKVKPALKQLIKAQAAAKLNFSFRTSVHVHVNVQELSHIQLINIIYTYLLLEEPLINFCGRERKGNRFCLRLQDAEGFMEYFKFLIQNRLKDFHMLNENSMRYSAINLAALRKYGSLEFRAMRGNLELKTLTDWVSALVQIKNYACQDKATPATIYQTFCEKGCEGFLRDVLGVYADAYIYPGFEKDMQRSFSLSIDAPFLYREYKHLFVEQPEVVAPKPLPKAKVQKFVVMEDAMPAAAAEYHIDFDAMIQRQIDRELEARRIRPAVPQF